MKQEIRKLLLIVDPQNDFISGSLAVEQALDIIDPICEWITLAKKEKYDICVTQDWHPQDHCSFSQFPPHCVATTVGANIEQTIQSFLTDYPTITIRKGELKDKEEFSGVCHIREIISLNQYDEIIICGIAGDYCVHDTIIDLCELGYEDRIFVDTKAIVSIDKGEKLTQMITRLRLRHR